MRFGCVVGMAFALLFPALARGQAPSELNGTWTLQGGLAGTNQVAANPSQRVTLAQAGSLITIRYRTDEPGHRCGLDGTRGEATYATRTGEWAVTSNCHMLGHALVLEETHANAATGQSWRSVSTFALDAQTRHLIVTRVASSSAAGPYMATSMRIYERTGQEVATTGRFRQ